MSISPIYVVTGGEGTSGEQVVRTALAQFADADLSVIIVPHIRELAELERVVQEAEMKQGTIVHTLVDLRLRLLGSGLDLGAVQRVAGAPTLSGNSGAAARNW